MSPAPGGQQVGRAGGSGSRATPPARVGGEARPGDAGTGTPRAAGPDSRPAPGGPAVIPRRAAPPAYPGRVSREWPRHPRRPRPRAAAAPRRTPRAPRSPDPRQAPRALTQRQQRQQQRPGRQAPHARRAGVTLRLLLLPRRLSSSSSSSSGCSRVGAPPPGPRACSALLASRAIPALGGRAPLAPAGPPTSSPPSSGRPGTGSRAPEPPRCA